MDVKRIKAGMLFGAIAGLIDVIPMFIQKLTLDANLSAFTFWIVAGFFISTTNIRLTGALKGIAVSIILMVPMAFIIGWNDPLVLVPIVIMNLILGSGIGILIDKYSV